MRSHAILQHFEIQKRPRVSVKLLLKLFCTVCTYTNLSTIIWWSCLWVCRYISFVSKSSLAIYRTGCWWVWGHSCFNSCTVHVFSIWFMSYKLFNRLTFYTSNTVVMPHVTDVPSNQLASFLGDHDRLYTFKKYLPHKIPLEMFSTLDWLAKLKMNILLAHYSYLSD